MIQFFSSGRGHIGYLREAYHGAPFATRYLVPEAFKSGDGVAAIPAALLRKRLPETLHLARERHEAVYHRRDDRAVRSFADFVELCERKEKETGAPVDIVVDW